VDSVEKFKETRLPSIEWFDNDLTGEKCSEDRYNKAVQVWNKLGCKTFYDDHMAYLEFDVVLLAEVFENYRQTSMKMFGLDPANWMKYSGQAIEVFSDRSMYEFFHSAIRGGMCSVGELTFANVYGKNGEVIIGFDMNALYPRAMMFSLPSRRFEWVDPEEAIQALSTYDLNTSNIGYYLEVDIEVPREIHDLVSAYPLFPEIMDSKLKAILYNKKNYRVHIAYLQLGLSLGYRISKVHGAVRFRQEPVMYSYIWMLAEERKKYPVDTFLNDLYKIMANSLFGKTIENAKNYRNHKIAIGDDDCLRLLNNNRIKNFHKLDRECTTVLAELEMDEVEYNKPIAIGCIILDLSKMYMHYFYYKVLKPYYGENM
jgi:hypothetical protein